MVLTVSSGVIDIMSARIPHVINHRDREVVLKHQIHKPCRENIRSAVCPVDHCTALLDFLSSFKMKWALQRTIATKCMSDGVVCKAV